MVILTSSRSPDVTKCVTFGGLFGGQASESPKQNLKCRDTRQRDSETNPQRQSEAGVLIHAFNREVVSGIAIGNIPVCALAIQPCQGQADAEK